MSPKAPVGIAWPVAAEALAALVPKDRLHPAVLSWADGRSANERWTLALSGGSDSVALLLLVWAHWPGRRRRLRAIHFDHGLRGRESAEDARFCARLCSGLGLPLDSGKAARSKGASEAQARQARFAFFERVMTKRRLGVLWFGHQQDDVAETILMRLSRGSGAAGLAAPRPVHEFPAGRVHLRPLLALRKAAIATALTEAGAVWREDSSNAGDSHFRNRLRRSVVPAWIRASGRDALSGAALTRELLEEDDRALEGWVDRLKPLNADGSLSLARVRGQPRAVVRRALRRWLSGQVGAGVISRQAFEALLAAVLRAEPDRHSLGKDGFAVIGSGRLQFKRLHEDRLN